MKNAVTHPDVKIRSGEIYAAVNVTLRSSSHIYLSISILILNSDIRLE